MVVRLNDRDGPLMISMLESRPRSAESLAKTEPWFLEGSEPWSPNIHDTGLLRHLFLFSFYS